MATTTSEQVETEALPLQPSLLRQLREALLAIRFGAIELVIHDGRVVQLERRERIRLDQGSGRGLPL